MIARLVQTRGCEPITVHRWLERPADDRPVPLGPGGVLVEETVRHPPRPATVDIAEWSFEIRPPDPDARMRFRHAHRVEFSVTVSWRFAAA